MQNRYVGDAGDFAKHGLLRRLSGATVNTPDLRLGLAWYMHADEHGGDGKHINYLDPNHKDAEKHRECDPDLWEALRQAVDGGQRHIRYVQGAGILPENTLYHDALLAFPPDMPRPDRERNRDHWFAEALRATAAADLVCLDPDNGITRPEQMYHKKGPKFTYISDLQAFWNRGQSLVVYQHLGMGMSAKAQIAEKVAMLRDGLDGAEPIPLWYHRGTARIFFVLPQPAHRDRLEARIRRMLDGPWGRNVHFERMEV